MPLKQRMVWTLLAALLLQMPALAAENASARYFVVFLRPHPARKPLPKEEAERVQAAHMANIRKMGEDGVLVAAGPFEDAPTTVSGIFIFKADSLETVEKIAAQDPTVVERRNTVDVHAWQGPAGIGDEYVRLHKLDPKTPENMQVHPFCMVFHGPEWGTNRNHARLVVHEKYIEQLRADGKLSAAGSIENSGDFAGLVIFKPIPADEAQKLLQADPAVKAGELRMECHRWWSSDHVLPW